MVLTIKFSELLIGCSGNEVYRMSLEEGRFLNPYSTGLNDVTSLVTSDDHYLVSIGGSNGIVECWDPRARSCIGKCQPTHFYSCNRALKIIFFRIRTNSKRR